ncbi:MAG: hydroxyisourate hydrolase [Leptolyngbya foveolarum]|uniref:5-hydroxyisourate hydrolase n=1 Tax=Leptolyngbya foveolarum TaxID=47253 RepID=A0A2W4TUI1_9CYAN|nr:MAG: hydroxyisourate hydrolase [Leptolyngbya foveolarum]
MTGKLTTHILDTAQGQPAANVTVELFQISLSQNAKLIKTLTTNADGRTDQPLLTSKEMEKGTYELRFAMGGYFAKQLDKLPDPLFLNIIPIRFSIADTSKHYHIPLLCSPWSYSTYRGS